MKTDSPHSLYLLSFDFFNRRHLKFAVTINEDDCKIKKYNCLDIKLKLEAPHVDTHGTIRIRDGIT